jgi:hypothetical protein
MVPAAISASATGHPTSSRAGALVGLVVALLLKGS